MRETAGPRRYVEEKIKENENATRGGEDEGVINIELSCTEIFSAFALSCDTVTNGLQLEERCLQNQGETLQCGAVYFSVIL